MAAASAPEEGKRCWLKVTYNGKTRMIEWRTNDGTFKQLDEKVRKLFSLNERTRLVYSYEEPTSKSDIVMSTDEELATALHFMNSEILVVVVAVEKKKRKTLVYRAYHSAQSRATVLGGRLIACARVFYETLKFIIEHIVVAVKTKCRQLCSCLCSRNQQQQQQQQQQQHQPSVPPSYHPHAHPRRPCRFGFSQKFALCFLFLVLAVVVAKRSEWREFRQHVSHYYSNSFYHNTPHNFGNHVTILAATYGGKDVTFQAREYYNKFGALKSSNELFGDPLPGVHKYLHVVYQYYSHNGLEVFSQSISESSAATLNMQRAPCAFPEEAIVDGSSVKILGALYDDVSATCPTRRLAATGKFSYLDKYYDSLINRNHFGSHSHNGVYTVVYVKDNVLRTFVGREGSHVIW